MVQRTPLYEEHKRLGGKMVEFAGWDMPVQYTGVKDEHTAVRTAAGLFDVSHMGQLEFTGKGAAASLQHLTTNDVSKLVDGQAQYSLLCKEDGGVIDDIIVYRVNAQRFVLVVNAANAAKDFAWLKAHLGSDTVMKDISADYAMIAFQGPAAATILASLTDADLTELGHYRFTNGTVADKACIVARTGYTGEDGFEIFASPADMPQVWQGILEAGKPRGVKPAGLGARDTLRLEMKYSLYGHEITEETNPLEAGLGWVVKLNTASDFIGKQAIEAIRNAGPSRALVGFRMLEPGIPRQGYSILFAGKQAGVVTSGTMSPSLDEAIGIGYVPMEARAIGAEISIDIRGRARKAGVVATPFYQKES
jgi:aminomethyltransferase